MAKFGGSVVSGATTFSPTVGQGNWFLESTSTTQMVTVQEVWLGGEVTSSTAMRTRIARDSAVGTTRTAGSVQKLDQTYIASLGNAAFFSTSYTSLPTIVAGCLVSFSWNANGGYIRWLAAPGEEFVMSTATSIECRADIGSGQSNYGVVWTEF
jgi:hypothetical protein